MARRCRPAGGAPPVATPALGTAPGTASGLIKNGRNGSRTGRDSSTSSTRCRAASTGAGALLALESTRTAAAALARAGLNMAFAPSAATVSAVAASKKPNCFGWTPKRLHSSCQRTASGALIGEPPVRARWQLLAVQTTLQRRWWRARQSCRRPLARAQYS